MNETPITNPDKRVTLYRFSRDVGCHFTTASRLRSGDRMPGGKILLNTVKQYGLDPMKTLEAFGTEDPEIFGDFLRKEVFHITDEDLANDKRGSGSPTLN